jgi:hypothetical protein
MAKIFVLQGGHNCGKTTTLKLVISDLQNTTPKPDTDDRSPKRTVERKVILNPVKGHKVGIETKGDKREPLQTSLVEFQKEGCDIIFCAAHPTGVTRDVVEAQRNSKNTIHYIEKKADTNANQQSTENQKMAKHIINLAGL